MGNLARGRCLLAPMLCTAVHLAFAMADNQKDAIAASYFVDSALACDTLPPEADLQDNATGSFPVTPLSIHNALTLDMTSSFQVRGL